MEIESLYHHDMYILPLKTASWKLNSAASGLKIRKTSVHQVLLGFNLGSFSVLYQSISLWYHKTYRNLFLFNILWAFMPSYPPLAGGCFITHPQNLLLILGEGIQESIRMKQSSWSFGWIIYYDSQSYVWAKYSTVHNKYIYIYIQYIWYIIYSLWTF